MKSNSMDQAEYVQNLLTAFEQLLYIITHDKQVVFQKIFPTNSQGQQRYMSCSQSDHFHHQARFRARRPYRRKHWFRVAAMCFRVEE